MIEIIAYLYRINIVTEYKYNNETIYKSDNSNYLYKEVEDIDRINILNKYITYLNMNRFYSYKFENNIYNNVVSNYQDKKFVLINIGNDYSKEVDFNDMLEFYSVCRNLLVNNNKYSNNWDHLWENKISYLFDHFNNNKLANKNIEILFYYYICVAENSLLYLSKINRKYKSSIKLITFTHRRISYPNTKFNFYNPLNFVVDLEVRDIAGYIKSLYYNSKDYVTELEYYLKMHKLDTYHASMLYARCIYPSIFFDDYEKNDINFNKYINFDSYDVFIKKIYDVISSYIYIDKIDF